MNNYLTIKEFAELVNKTPQSIYKRLKKENNTLQDYLKIENNKKYIHKKAVKLYKQPVVKPVEDNNNPPDIVTIDEIKEELKFLKEQLNLAQENLAREQALHVDTRMELQECKKRLELLEEPIQPVVKPVVKPVENNKETTTKKKWWKFWE